MLAMFKIIWHRPKDVYFDGGCVSCGKAKTIEQARDLAWKHLPTDIQEGLGSKDNLDIIEFKTQFLA